jgi:hypothetical protein
MAAGVHRICHSGSVVDATTPTIELAWPVTCLGSVDFFPAVKASHSVWKVIEGIIAMHTLLVQWQIICELLYGFSITAISHAEAGDTELLIWAVIQYAVVAHEELSDVQRGLPAWRTEFDITYLSITVDAIEMRITAVSDFPVRADLLDDLTAIICAVIIDQDAVIEMLLVML